MERFEDYARQSGSSSASIAPGATVTVYSAGTVTLATIFDSNSVADTKSNPFTADATSGLFHFYAGDGKYDVQISGTGVTTSYSWGEVLLDDSVVSPTVYNVQNYGAVGDGTTDDAVAIQAALDAAGSTGRVHFPPLTYKVGTTLFAGANTAGSGSSTFFVSGYGATLLGTMSGTPIWDWGGVANTPGKKMEGLTFQGDTTTTPSCALLLTRSDVLNGSGNPISSGLIHFKDVSIKGEFSIAGVYNLCSESHTWENCHITLDDGSAALSCFILAEEDDHSMTYPNYTPNTSTAVQQWFQNCSFFFNPEVQGAGESCFENLGWDHVQFNQCQFGDNQDIDADAHSIPLVLAVQSASGSNLDTMQLDGCFFHGTYHRAVQVGTAALTTVVRNLVMTGCTFRTESDHSGGEVAASRYRS